MIRVAHVVASFGVGGLQKGVVNVVNRSDASAFDHLIVSVGPDLAMADRLERGRVETLGLASGEKGSLGKALAGLLRGFGADVVHTRNWPTLVDGWRARRRARTRAHIHGYHGRDAAGAHGFGWKRRVVGRCLTRFVDSVVVLTRNMGAEYERDFGAPRGGMRVIPNGVELPDDRPRHRAADDPFRVLAVGRLDPVKNYGSLIRAFATMAGRGAQDRLVILGEGPDRDLLLAAASEAGVADAVEMPGMVTETAAEYARADVFVQSSIYEGMSNTLTEAMATGLPVLATRVGGNPDVVGDAGVLYSSGDEPALARHLAEFRSAPSLAAELGNLARHRAESEFSYERMIGSYEGLYRELVEVS